MEEAQLEKNGFLKKEIFSYPYFLNFFRSNMLFVNTFLHPKFGDLYLKLDNNNRMNVYSKNRNNEQFFNKISKYHHMVGPNII